MNKFATNETRKPARIGNLAIISGAMLGAVGVFGPALSADLPDDYPPYRPTNYRNYNSNCCERQFERVAVPPPMVEERVVERPVIEERVVERPVVEERVVQRRYIEREYPSYAATTRYAYSSYPDHYRCPARCAESYPAYEPAPYREQPCEGFRMTAPCETIPRARGPSYESFPAPYRERRRRFGYVGAHYPPVPAAYKYESEPRVPYRYAASSHYPYDYYRPSYEPGYNAAYQYKPAYEYEPSPRPPAAVPGGYYGPGYFE